ncbi:MAG: hypothetical protein AAFP86_09630, partial [Planctomycetota bacterium]
GQPVELALDTSGARATIEDPALVLGKLTYGIFDRVPSQPPALLVYDAKAAWSLEDASKRAGLEVEVCARADGDDLVLKVYDIGEPAVGAELVVEQDGSFAPTTYETDAKGEVRIPMPASPVFAARARVIWQGTGEHEGKEYGRILRYSTICIERLFAYETAEGSDYEADTMLNEVRVRAGCLPADATGIKGSATATIGGERARITFEWAPSGMVAFEASDLEGADAQWARETLVQALELSAGQHLGGGAPVSFVDVPEGGSSATLRIGDGTTCRIEDHELREMRWTRAGVTHAMLVGEWIESEAGRILPAAETRATFSDEGSLERCVSIRRTYQTLGPTELPDVVECSTVGPTGSVRRILDFGTLDLVQ